MSNRKVRSAIAAVAGTTVGVGAVAVAAPANASTTVTTVPVAARAAAAFPPICDSWSDFTLDAPNGDPAVQYVPTAGRNSFNIECLLTQDPSNVYGGVAKLQTALNKCYAANLDVDGRYGPLTAAKVLVKIQQPAKGGTAQDGNFGAIESALTNYPSFYTSDGQWTGDCRRFF